MGISSFVLALCQLLERPVPCRGGLVADRERLLAALRGVTTRPQAIAFLRSHFLPIMALPWQRTDVVSELCRTFSASELEEATIFLSVPTYFKGTGYVINRSTYRREVNHPHGAHLHYFGNWLIHAWDGTVEAYDYSHVINHKHSEVLLHDVAYMTAPDRVYYALVSMLQENLSSIDQLRLAELGDRIIRELTQSLSFAPLNLSACYLRPQQFNGDVLVYEDEQWAVVYNHYIGGTYSVLAKVKESVITSSLSLDLIPRRLSLDVKQLLRALVADRFVAYANGNGQLPVLLDGVQLQVVYNKERDGFVVYGAYADSPYDTIPFFCEYDYRKSLVENLTGLRQVLSSRTALVDRG